MKWQMGRFLKVIKFIEDLKEWSPIPFLFCKTQLLAMKPGFPLRCSCINLVKYSLYPFEALVEISDFVTGLVQRVPKKPSFAKADLQNSTA